MAKGQMRALIVASTAYYTGGLIERRGLYRAQASLSDFEMKASDIFFVDEKYTHVAFEDGDLLLLYDGAVLFTEAHIFEPMTDAELAARYSWYHSGMRTWADRWFARLRTRTLPNVARVNIKHEGQTSILETGLTDAEFRAGNVIFFSAEEKRIVDGGFLSVDGHYWERLSTSLGVHYAEMKLRFPSSAFVKKARQWRF